MTTTISTRAPLPLVDETTGLRRGAVRYPQGSPPLPGGCRWCGVIPLTHGPEGMWTAGKGFHAFEPPTAAQEAARRAARQMPEPVDLTTGCDAMTHNSVGAERFCVNDDPLHTDDHDDGCGDTWPVESWER